MPQHLLSIIYYPLSIICGRGCGRSGRNRDRSGFTLIEILVAVSILLVAVVMASMVFQQATGAFETGARKVDSQVILRNILGAITRDLSQAADAADYAPLTAQLPAPGSSSQSISFIALTGTPGKDLNGSPAADVRTAQVIKYSMSDNVVTREVSSTTCDENGWRVKGGENYSRSSKLNDTSEALEGLTLEFTSLGDDASAPLPDRVVVRASVKTKTRVTSVGAWSFGPDGDNETDDDIYVGYQP